MNPEKAEDCSCCFVESDECQTFEFNNERLCPDCLAFAEKIIKKLKGD